MIINGIVTITGRKNPKTSRHIVVPVAVLREFGIDIGDQFEYKITHGKLILTPLKRM